MSIKFVGHRTFLRSPGTGRPGTFVAQADSDTDSSGLG